MEGWERGRGWGRWGSIACKLTTTAKQHITMHLTVPLYTSVHHGTYLPSRNDSTAARPYRCHYCRSSTAIWMPLLPLPLLLLLLPSLPKYVLSQHPHIWTPLSHPFSSLPYPAMAVQMMRFSGPYLCATPTTMGMKAAVGPPIPTFEPPRAEIRKPATTQVYSLEWGGRREGGGGQGSDRQAGIE